MSLAETPMLYLTHLYAFTFVAVGAYFLYDSYLSPLYKDSERNSKFKSLLWPLTIGMGLQWHAPMMVKLFGAGIGSLGLLRSMVAIAFVFAPVKSLGFCDYGEFGLSPHEQIINDVKLIK